MDEPDELDDLVKSIINAEPQLEKAEVFSLESQEEDDEILNTPCVKCGDTATPLHANEVCGNCYTPESVEIKNKDEDDPLQYRRIKKVPYLRRWPKCSLCKNKLLGDRFGWHAEDEDGNHWWWCVPCMEKCNCYATEEEIKRAKNTRI